MRFFVLLAGFTLGLLFLVITPVQAQTSDLPPKLLEELGQYGIDIEALQQEYLDLFGGILDQEEAETDPEASAQESEQASPEMQEDQNESGEDETEMSPAEMAAEAYLLGHYELALNVLLRTAMEGDAESAYLLGHAQDHGNHLEPDADAARSWYQRAASAGYAEAKVALARMTLEAHFSDDPQTAAALDEAESLLREATDLPPALYWLARYYDPEDGIKPDAETSHALLLVAVSGGYRYAMLRLSARYCRGTGGVEGDPESAYLWRALAFGLQAWDLRAWDPAGCRGDGHLLTLAEIRAAIEEAEAISENLDYYEGWE